MSTQAEKAARFVALHQQCFITPNPWDFGSARLLESMGFQALATSSAGLAWSRGGADMSVARPAMMAYLRELCAATTLPVSADLQHGYGDAPELIHDCIVEAAATGVVGASIEDAGGDGAAPIYDLGLAVERIRAAVRTARAENYLYGKPDLDDTIRRLQAYQEAGADVLFAPGLTKAADIRAVASALDRPLNVMMGLPNMQLTLRQLEELGVRRVSVGGSLAKVAYDALMRAGREMLERGSFDYAQTALSSGDINAIMGRP